MAAFVSPARIADTLGQQLKEYTMAWIIRIVAVLILAGLAWLLFTPSRPPPLPVSPKPVLKLPPIVTQTVANVNANAPTRVTVYQQAGDDGIPSFSDRAERGQPQVIDQRTGTTYSSTGAQATYQSTYHGQVPNTASLSYTPAVPVLDPIERLKQDHRRLQQQVQQQKQQRMAQATGY